MSAPTQDRQEMAIGQLVAKATADVSLLLRQEVALAKLELKKDAVAAGKGAGLLGAAAALSLFAGLFLSIALAYALGRIFNLGSGFLLVGVLYLLLAAVLGFVGYKSLKKVGPPTKTIETVKDDIAWAKHPTSVPPSHAH